MTEESRQKIKLRGLKVRIFAISFSACLITVMIVAALSLSGESPAYSPNSKSVGFSGVSIAGNAIQSSGFGFSMVSRNNGLITITSTVVFFFSTVPSRASFYVYFSTVSVPSLGSIPNVGDIQATFTYEDITFTTNVVSLSLTGRITTSLGASFFLYLAMSQSNAGGTLNIAAGNLVAIEG